MVHLLNVIKETCIHICSITNGNIWLGPKNYMTRSKELHEHRCILTTITLSISMIVRPFTKTLLVFCWTHQLVLSSVAFLWPVASIMVFQCYNIHVYKLHIVVIWFQGYEKKSIKGIYVYSFIHRPFSYGESVICMFYFSLYISRCICTRCAVIFLTQFQLICNFLYSIKDFVPKCVLFSTESRHLKAHKQFRVRWKRPYLRNMILVIFLKQVLLTCLKRLSILKIDRS